MLREIQELVHSAHLRPQFVRFLLVGVLNTIVGQGIFVGLVLLGLNHLIALLIATILGVLFNFQTIGNLVFRNGNSRLLVRFVLCYAFAYAINALALSGLVHSGLTPIIGQALLVLPVAIMVFFISRRYVFVPTQ